MLRNDRRSGDVFGGAAAAVVKGRFVASCAARSAILMAHFGGSMFDDEIGVGRYDEVVRVSES